MNANYAEICRVGKLKADFQQVPLVQYCCETPIIQIPQRKLKYMSLDKKIQKITLL